MKLQDALKKIIREFGMSVLREKRLVFLLSDYKAFDDYPAVKQIMKSIAEDGYGKELCRLGMDVSGEECLNYAGRLKKTLSGDKHFKPELADYAVDCILFSMGFVSSVRETSDHGFDPFGNGSASHEQGIQKDSDNGHKNENQTGTESAEDWYRLGMSYANGSGVDQNYSMAVEYWRKAAELGHSGAQCRLGFAYAHGQGVVQDNAEALIWYRKAAAQGDALARKEMDDLLRHTQRVHEKQFADTKSGGIHSAGTGSQAVRQSEAGARYSGSHAPSRDSSGSPVISDGIGRMEFWVKQILCSFLMIGVWFSCYLFDSKGFPNLAMALLALDALGFIFYTMKVWVGRAHDLGEEGFVACRSAAFAYLSLIILVVFADWLQTSRGQDIQHILRNKDHIRMFLALLVLSVAGGCKWIKYGFFKGRHS